MLVGGSCESVYGGQFQEGFSSNDISDICAFCGKEVESIRNLFQHCELSYAIWSCVWEWGFLGACLFHVIRFLHGGWSQSQDTGGFYGSAFPMVYCPFGKKEKVGFLEMK